MAISQLDRRRMFSIVSPERRLFETRGFVATVSLACLTACGPANVGSTRLDLAARLHGVHDAREGAPPRSSDGPERANDRDAHDDGLVPLALRRPAAIENDADRVRAVAESVKADRAPLLAASIGGTLSPVRPPEAAAGHGSSAPPLTGSMKEVLERSVADDVAGRSTNPGAGLVRSDGLYGPALPPVSTDVPYVCETFRVEVKKTGKSRHRRNRKKWYINDRDRFKELIRLVTREMGADPRLFQLWSMRESSLNPTVLHVLNPDLEGSLSAWRKHRYDPIVEADLLAQLDRLPPRDPERWEIRGRLKRMRKFKDNPYYDHQIEYEVHLPDGETVREHASSWSYGYGPFGMNPTLFLPRWDVTAPPWIFCENNGIPAIITAVWAARVALSECVAQGHPPNYETVNRRFSSGHCRPRPSRAPKFHARAKRNGLDHLENARLGQKWKREETDTAEVYRHMVELARMEGLLP